jgi:flagellar biosynthesis repressor protein FlbT
MKNTLKISLKPNEKLYVNGAVLRVDRKVSIELLNDVQFLLENHVLQAEDASTPLRQLYFIVQIMLMNPEGAGEARAMFRKSLPLLLASFADEQIRAALKHVDQLVGEDHVYDALKAIRALYALERHIIEQGQPGGDNPAQARQPRTAGEIHP